MVFPNVEVIVQVRGKIDEKRADYLRELVHTAIGKAAQAEAATLMAAGPGKGKYADTIDLVLFKLEICIKIDRQISEKFLKSISDSALAEVFTDLGREWIMESVENAVDTVTQAASKAWGQVTDGIAEALNSAAQAIGGNKSDRA